MVKHSQHARGENYHYLNKTKSKLDVLVGSSNDKLFKNLRKKWATAAIIALASGSTIFLAESGKANADTVDPNQAGQTSQPNLTSKIPENPVDLTSMETKVSATSQANKQSAEQTSASEKQDSASDASQAKTNTKSATSAESASAQTVQAQANQTSQTQSATDQAENQTTANEDQTADEAGQKDANRVELPANHQDHVKGNVQDAWDQGYKGEHTVVAVIDSGVDVYHKDFLTMPSDPKFTADQMKEMIKELGYGRYVDEKFPYVYNYVDNENEHMEGPDEEPHGQHVSGIIAADGHPDGDKEYVVGVAPEAQLMHFKVFGDTTTSLDIAREIYDAVRLGADVIQMSLGGGVSAADLNVADQRAVQYAVDHGVIVSISASNNGNASSVDNPTHLTDTENYEAGGNAGNYNPFSSSTVADPGAARNAITVAAETSGLGDNSDMASFSSWGPLPDFTLKPDVSAPGVDVISLANNNEYTTMSGTSMAGPFVAGAAALVKQRLAKTNPELQGAALVAAVKALLMNTANPQTRYNPTNPQTQAGYNTIVSPRRQGSGQINVGAATRSQAYITTEDGTSSVSLKQVGDSTDFELTFHNLSDSELTYDFDDQDNGYTEFRDEDTGEFYDVPLAGAKVSGLTSVLLAPKETKTVKLNLALTGLKKNQLVEGFLKFKNAGDSSTLVVPYLGYYGDMTSENVFDQNANNDAPDIQGNRFVNEDNYPRGIADEESLKELVNIDGTYNWQEVAKLYESGKVAFSPNADHKSDLLRPYAYLKQNLKDLQVQILDAKGNVVRVLADSHGVEKSYHSDGTGTVDFGYGVNNSDAFEWDGKLYDAKTGEMVAAPDGNYTYRFVATLFNDGENKVQTNDTPVVIDTSAPVLSNVTYDDATHTLSGSYADKGAGFTDYSYATVTVNDQVFGFKLNDDASAFDDNEKLSGHFSYVLSDDALKALTQTANKITLAVSDVADNTALQTLDVAPVKEGPNKVSVWNAVSGLPFSENSSDYNAENKTFTLKGAADRDFFVNGKLVQVENGQFTLPVSVDETDLVFSSDFAGKKVIGSFTSYTPKAQFAWQHVDGENKSFGSQIYSVFGSNPDDIVVQAAVSKGSNVKAYAKDYSTGEVYTGVVQDGVATFHVHTSINKNKDTGVFARALLQGWTEIDGPAFNDKQVTDPTPIKDANYLGVYYKADATSTTYTDRDKLGVDMKDEPADVKAFGPGAYPGYDNSSDPDDNISFDYMNNNGVTVYGNEAVVNGYYDPETKLFTVTGKVQPNVVALTFLADSPYEVDPNNQADISNNGKFTTSFKIDPSATRQLSYFYRLNDGELKRGSLSLILDVVAPTLKVDQAGSDEVTELTTSDKTFKLSGSATDNLDGYGVFINGDNVFSEFATNGYNYIPEINLTADQTSQNSFAPYKFEKEFNLDDNDGQETTHVFTVEVVDQAGNRSLKKFLVHYVPEDKTDPAKQGPATSDGTKDNGSDQSGAKTDKGSTTDEGAKVGDPEKQDPATLEGAKGSDSDQSGSKSSEDSSSSNGSKEANQGTSSNSNNTTDAEAGKTDSSASANEGKNSESQASQEGSKPDSSTGSQAVDVQPTTPVVTGTPASSSQPESASTVASTQQRNASSNGVAEINDPSAYKKLYHNAYVYTAQGDLVKKAKKSVTLKKKTVVKVLDKGRVVLIKGKKYYRVGKNKFVKVANTLRVKTVRKAYVYNAKGKVVRKQGKKVSLKKDTLLKVLNKRKPVVINGEKFYQIGKDQFVKVKDTVLAE